MNNSLRSVIVMMSIILTQQLNMEPVIGILTQPSDEDYKTYPKDEYSYLAASYVKFFENAGSRIVPIPYEADDDMLDKYFAGINGLIIPGGTLELDSPDGPTKFTRTVAYLLERALVANDAGDYFPIMGICLGHQTLHFIISGYKNAVLFEVANQVHVNHPINVLYKDMLFYKTLSKNIYDLAVSKDIVFFNTNFGVSPDFYTTNYQLSQFFRITAVNTDSNGQVFISAAEGKQYPVYTVQYHPEKPQFEWNVSANHELAARKFGQNHANQFVQQARFNTHQFDKAVMQKAIIYNYEAIELAEASFMQIYVFKNGQLGI